MITKNVISLLILLVIGAGLLVDATLRGDQSGNAKSDRSLKGKTTPGEPNTLTSSVQNPLDGYNSCDDLKADLVKSIKATGNATIQNHKNWDCDSYYYYGNGTSSPNNTDDIISNRRLGKKVLFKTAEPINAEASFKANNQVDGVDEQNTIVSDGKYLFVGDNSNIFVLDLNGKIVANVSLPAPLEQKNTTAFSQYITSVFIDDNILTVLANTNWFDDLIYVDSSIRAIIYQVIIVSNKLELTLVKDFDLLPACASKHCNIAKSNFESRSTGSYTCAFNVVSQGIEIWEYGRCSKFKNLTANEYEQVALELLSVDAEKDADEIVNTLTVGVDKETQLCKNVRKIPEDLFASWSDRLSFLQVTSFGYNKTLNSVQVDTFAVPFRSYDYDTPVIYTTKNSTLIAVPQDGVMTSLLKYDFNGTKFILKAVGSVEVTFYSSTNIDYYNGYYRIFDYSNLQIYVLKEKESQLQIVGQVKGFSTGEHPNSVKFVADKGVVQTSMYDDKSGEIKVSWMVVSFSNPLKPRIVGKKLIMDEYFSSVIGTYPIEGGNYIVSFSSVKNDTGIAVQLYQVTQGGIKLLHNKSETVFSETEGAYSYINIDISSSNRAFRYLPQSKTLVVPMHAVTYDNNFTSTSNFDGFLVYHVNLERGVTYVRNVTQSSNPCSVMPEQSMEINGNLFTFMGGAIKKTSLANPLSADNWEVQVESGCSYY